MVGKLQVAVACAILLFMSLPVTADHPQDGGDVAFDHVKGNEWWVEVDVSGDIGWDVVRARDDGGEWVQLTKRSWGVWAGSFHIEPGHRVQFEATYTPHSGRSEHSCWFTHPEGVEQCDEGSAGPVAFDHTGGNEWWVQVDVDPDVPRVQSQDTGGPWVELEKRSWGDWAASYHIEPGHDVRFRALVDGGWHESCWFTHPEGKAPDGGEVCADAAGEPDPGPEPEPEPGFAADFDPVPGNQWWVEVHVDANEPLAGVDARDDGGPWIALQKQDWGAWAKSFHVEDGSIIEFRARSTDQETDVSQGYRWPDAEPVASDPEPEPEPSTVDVAFGPKAGNQWWVEAYIIGDGEEVSSAAARVVGGSWHALTHRDWGTWAASFHVPSGSQVEFRATTANGTDTSVHFTWPDARPASGSGSWPEEGSYLYAETWYDPPGSYQEEGTRTRVYHDGTWWEHQQWTSYYDGDVQGHEQRFDQGTGACPGYGPTSGVAPGDDVLIRDCGDGERNATVRGKQTQDVRVDGATRTIDIWYATDRDPCNCVEWQVAWDDETGLVTYANLAGRSADGAELRDTDAPLGAA